MELFIELIGKPASGKTRVIQSIKELLEKDYHVNWRQQDEIQVRGNVAVQVVADLAKKREA